MRHIIRNTITGGLAAKKKSFVFRATDFFMLASKPPALRAVLKNRTHFKLSASEILGSIVHSSVALRYLIIFHLQESR